MGGKQDYDSNLPMHTPEGNYDELIHFIKEAQDTLPARCEELAQRCDTLAVKMREENAVLRRNTRIQLATIAVGIAALLVLSAIAVTPNSQSEKPTPAQK